MKDKTKEQLIKEIDQLKVKIDKLVGSESEYKKKEKRLKESEERYKGIIQSTASCIAVYEAIDNGQDFVFVDFNPMAEKVEQISKDKAIGKKVTEVFPGVKEFGLFKVFQNVWKTGKPEHFPVSVYKDERIHGYRENYVYKLSSGEIVAVYQDFTERKLAEEALQESERKRTIWIENSPVCTKVVDLDFNLQFMSTSGIRELKIDDITEFYGKPYPLHFFPDSFKISMADNLKKVKETGKKINMEGQLSDTKGNKLWFLHDLVPVNDDNGKLDYILVVSAEITERKQAEEKLKLHHDQLEELVKERTAELDEKNQKLSEQMKIFVGRELKIRDLEKRIRALTGNDNS
jgi:PAS domain S-box-containing protein